MLFHFKEWGYKWFTRDVRILFKYNLPQITAQWMAASNTMNCSAFCRPVACAEIYTSKEKLSSTSPSTTPHLCQTVHINPQTQAWRERLLFRSEIMEAEFLQHVFLNVHLWLGEALSWFSGSDPFILQVDNSLTMIIHCDLCQAASSADPAGNISHSDKQTPVWGSWDKLLSNHYPLWFCLMCISRFCFSFYLCHSITYKKVIEATEADFFSFDMGDCPWGIRLAVDRHLVGRQGMYARGWMNSLHTKRTLH